MGAIRIIKKAYIVQTGLIRCVIRDGKMEVRYVY